MICFPNAKINIGLRVVEKRPDGYHNLETVFYPIGLKDALEVVPAALNTDFSIDSEGISPDENIVTKAFRLLQSAYSLQPAACYLRKKIPVGAGLGGGSSDGANALRIIASMNGLDLSEQELEQFSAQLGADCAFFIKNNPIFASGIGTAFEKVTLSLAGYHLILVKPDIHVSTVEAYSLVKPKRPNQRLKEMIECPLDSWKETIFNDFEEPIFHKYPEIGRIKEKLYHHGAIFAAMSGSGSSVYGLFKDAVDLRSEFLDCFYWSEKLLV